MVKRLEKKKEKVPFVDWFLSSNGATSVAVVILGFLAGVILLLCIGKSPAGLFKAIGQSMFGKAGKNGGYSSFPRPMALVYSCSFTGRIYMGWNCWILKSEV